MAISFSQIKNHPIRQILTRAATMSAQPDEDELSSINAPAEIIDEVRQNARDLAEAGARGGLRARHDARKAAEQLTLGAVASIPPQYADAVQHEDAEPEDSGALATRILDRARRGRTHAEDHNDRARLLDAARTARSTST